MDKYIDKTHYISEKFQSVEVYEMHLDVNASMPYDNNHYKTFKCSSGYKVQLEIIQRATLFSIMQVKLCNMPK